MSPRVCNAINPETSPFESLSTVEREILTEKTFKRMIAIERKRTERSKEPFLLMLVEADNYQGSEREENDLEKVASALELSSRDTDVIGWYKDGTTIGVMFTGLVITDKNLILSTILSRLKTKLRDELKFDQFDQLDISFHFFPDEWDQSEPGRPIDSALYPDLIDTGKRKQSQLLVKRVIDIVGSALALILCMPLFYVIGIAIKVSSKGPILFRQKRIGQFGQRFTLLKFRSMHTGNDHSVHKEFVAKLIADDAGQNRADGTGKEVYKITNDRRVTRVGRFLRRTSLDELPQFLNVLMGDMSLVGPRPAVRYELAAYQTWHRRRVLDFKPGITGLWQVAGRSRVKFDDMVRLDLRYAASWSPWLDLEILMRTPLAVIKGSGAC